MKLEKKYLVKLIILSFFALINLVLLILLIDMFNIRTFGIVLSFVIYALLIAFLFYFLKKKWYIKLATILGGILVISITFTVAHPLTSRVKAVNYDNPEKTQIIEVEGGKIRGVLSEDKEVEIYTGIPYAKAPVGDLRWVEPQNVESWEGIKECDYFAPKAMQAKTNWFFDTGTRFVLENGWNIDYHSYDQEEMSEDCLYLNVFKSKNATGDSPVLVFYHGGSLMSGSTSFGDYRGEEFARKGVIFVSVAYRVGVFGYFAHQELIDNSLHHTTGNYGLLDQIKALKWVNDNIHVFGGDKNNITIAGESAGSSSVSAICSSPLAKGLFKKAIGESSSVVTKVPPHTYRSLDKALEMGNDIMSEFKCQNISELRNVKAEKLINTKYENNALTIDGYALEKSPYEVYLANEQNEEALLNGCNLNEADSFIVSLYMLNKTNLSNYKERLEGVFDKYTDKILALYPEIKTNQEAYEVFNEILSVYWFVYPHHSWQSLAKQNGEKVYNYLFTKTNGYMSTWHSGEMIYAYDNVKNSSYPYRYDDSDLALATTMSSYWVNFIKNGNPNGDNLPTWDEWNQADNKVMELGLNVSKIDDPFSKLYPVLEEFEKYTYNNINK